MGKIRTVVTLRRKRNEITASIRLYEKQLAQARSDLAHVTAAIRIFEASGRPANMARYIDTYRLFKRGEPWAICNAALAKDPLDTRQLALKGMDLADTVLAKGLTNRLIHSLRMQEQRGRVQREGSGRA